MKTLNVLIASSDRASANRIEALLRDVCFERVMVDCKRSAQIGDIEKHARVGWTDLTILSPDHLLSSSRQRGFPQVMAESLHLIRHIRKQTLMPFIAFGVSAEDTTPVLDAGVETVLGPLWNADYFKNELERILRLPGRVEERPEPSRWQLLGNLLRGLPLKGSA
jgi:hypothetical protein